MGGSGKGRPMAQESPVNDDVIVVNSAGYDEDQFEWENVHEEAPDSIVFNREGDKYVGIYLGSEIVEFDRENKKTGEIEHNEFTVLHFRDPEGLKDTNAGFELEKAFKAIEPNSVVRILLVKFVDVDQASPMKSFRIDVARNGNKAS